MHKHTESPQPLSIPSYTKQGCGVGGKISDLPKFSTPDSEFLKFPTPTFPKFPTPTP